MTTIKEILNQTINSIKNSWLLSDQSFENNSLTDGPSERKLISKVKKTPKYVQFIQNNYSEKLTEAVQLAAVKSNHQSIKYITNPTEKVQLTAIKKNPFSIELISNPTEKVQMEAINEYPGILLDINNPTEKVQLAAIEKEITSIQYIKSPSEKVQLAAIEKDPKSIQSIDNPSEKVQLAAIEKDPYSIKYIKNPTEKVIQNLPEDLKLKYFEFFPEQVQLNMIEKDPSFISYPSESLQIVAIKKDPSLIESIDKPSEAIISAAKTGLQNKSLTESKAIDYLSQLCNNGSIKFENKVDEILFNKEYDFIDKKNYISNTYDKEYQESYYADIWAQGEEEREYLKEWYKSEIQKIKNEANKIIKSFPEKKNNSMEREMKQSIRSTDTTLASEFEEKGYESIAETINEKITKFSGKDNTKETCHQLEILKSGARTLYGDITVEKTNGVFSASVNNLSIKDTSTGKTENLRANGMDIKQIPADNMKKLLSGGTVQKANQSLSLSKMAGGWTFKAATMVFSTAESQASI